MKVPTKTFATLTSIAIVVLVCVGIYAYDSLTDVQRVFADVKTGEPVISTVQSSAVDTVQEPKKDIHMQMPEQIRGVYVSSYSFMSDAFLKRLDTMIDNTTINAIVVDIKDAPGTILFDIGMDTPCVTPSLSLQDLEDRLDYYQQKGVYTIARVAVFRDACFAKAHPELAVQHTQSGPWRDAKGNYWLAPHEPETLAYIKNIAQAVYDRGFDEVQFDYVRYPSDGNMKTVAYEYTPGQQASSSAMMKRRATLKHFFEYMRSELVGIPLSADVFGMVLTNTDDLTIGQHLEDIAPYVDAISGMIYPSHFPKNWNGIVEPNRQPYQTVYDSSKMGLDRMSVDMGSSTARKISRPWLQDFSIYGVDYNAPEVKAQIKALDDLGIHNFLLWNASNRYTPGVLSK